MIELHPTKGPCLRITFSALGPSVAQQLAAAGYASGMGEDRLDRLEHAITLLHVQGLLTDAETDRARGRLVKQLKIRPAEEQP